MTKYLKVIILSEPKRLASLNLTGSYSGKPGSTPLSCNKPQQPTIYVLVFQYENLFCD